MFVSCTHVLSFGFVTGSDTRALCSVSCEIAVSSVDCTQFGFLSAACIHVMSCAVWHAACIFHWLRAFMLSCLV